MSKKACHSRLIMMSCRGLAGVVRMRTRAVLTSCIRWSIGTIKCEKHSSSVVHLEVVQQVEDAHTTTAQQGCQEHGELEAMELLLLLVSQRCSRVYWKFRRCNLRLCFPSDPSIEVAFDHGAENLGMFQK
jgi:hypothetical protein